jgi:tetratricopeptide (TPR) repeat protein
MKYMVVILIFGILAPWQASFGGEKAKGEAWRHDTTFLPQYCKDRAADKEAFKKKWGKVFGGSTLDIHHYCGGIYAEQKAKASLSEGERGKYLDTVIYQMKYVSNRCTTGCVLYPELHTRWGWALGEKGQAGEAIQQFKLAMKRNPKYTPAYAKLSDLYIEANQPDEAKKILESGLKAKPGSRMLKRRLAELK